MSQLVLQNKAQEALDYLLKYEKDAFDSIVVGLNNIKVNGWLFPDLKLIGNGIKRLRIGKWRILITQENDKILVRIIAIEKDTTKDYNRRKTYILNQL